MDDICSWATKDVQILIKINWLFTGINLTSSSTWRGIKLKVAVAKPGYETRFVNAVSFAWLYSC